MSAALGISQLRRITKINDLRRNAARFYNLHLNKIPGIIIPKIINDKSHSYHLYTIRITKKYGMSRNKLFEILKKKGIRTTVYWKPLHEFTAYKNFTKKNDLKNTITIYEQMLSLPLYPMISKKYQILVVNCIKNYQKN